MPRKTKDDLPKKRPVGRPKKEPNPIPLGEAKDAAKKRGPGRKTKYGRAQERDELARVSYAKITYGIIMRPDEDIRDVKKELLAKGIGWMNMTNREVERLAEVLAHKKNSPCGKTKRKRGSPVTNVCSAGARTKSGKRHSKSGM